MQLINSDLLPFTAELGLPPAWPTPDGNYYLHLASISHNFKDYIVFTCIRGADKGTCYCEELTTTMNSTSQQIALGLKLIQDENLKEDLVKFAEEKGLLNIPERIGQLIDQGKLEWLLN